MAKAAAKSQIVSAAIEVCREHLYLAVLERHPEDGMRLRSRSLAWRHECHTLVSEQGIRELGAGLAALASQEKLGGHSIHLTLSGDYCVTRVLSGPSERVRRELDLLLERSALYLMLGHGPKAAAHCTVPIDARHHHALMAVTNEQTLLALRQAAITARLDIDRVEPSLVALSRYLGNAGLDAEAPVLMVHLGDRVAAVGISQHGRLLLDYRPAGRSVQENVAAIIAGHLRRLQRFCDRQHGCRRGRLEQVYLCGLPERMAELEAAFSRHPELKAQVLWPTLDAFGPAAGPNLAANAPAGSEVCPALGTCLWTVQPERERMAPNLMAPIHAAHQERLSTLLARALWPAAASLLVSASLYGAAGYRHFQGRRLASAVEGLKPVQERVIKTQREVAAAKSKAKFLSEIHGHISRAASGRLLETIGQCLPPDVWLEKVDVDAKGSVKLVGSGLGDEGVFEFVQWLTKAPGLSQVQLEGTTTSQVAHGEATRFEVKFDFVNDSMHPSGSETNDGNDPKALSGNLFPPTDRHNPNFGFGAAGGLARGR